MAQVAVCSQINTKHININPFTDEAQTALVKDPSPYRAVNTFHLGYSDHWALRGLRRVNSNSTVWAERRICEC